MRPNFEEILRDHNVHNILLNENSMIEALEKTYDLGIKENEEKYDKLKIAFLDLLENWGDYGKYNSSRNHMEEDWKKQAGLL